MPELHSETIMKEELASSNWIEIAESVVQSVLATVKFWFALYEFIYLKKDYSASTAFGEDKWAKVQVFSLSLIFKLWKLKHYRSPSFQQDMIDNLKNVGIPGTGIPLSIFCYNYWTCLLFVLILNPLVCLCGAVNKARKETHQFEKFVALTNEYYVAHLLHPDDWFSLWRLNCRLVSYHSCATQSDDYKQEDKWTFLTSGKELGVPVTPYDDSTETLVCKNKNIEGGMGIYFYKNAAFGGDWILQEKLGNAEWLNALLPPNAPLSTMRVITTSSWSLTEEYPLRKVLSMISSVSNLCGSGMGDDGEDELGVNDLSGCDLDVSRSSSSSSGSGSGGKTNRPASRKSGLSQSSTGSKAATTSDSGNDTCQDLLSGLGGISHVDSRDGDQEDDPDTVRMNSVSSSDAEKAAAAAELLEQARKHVRAESGVLRLGRMDAKTDHSSILFDVDLSTGLIRGGTSNSQWYQLGLAKAAKCPWLPPFEGLEQHPDGARPQVKGKYIPDIQHAVDIVTSAHFKMMPDVPVVGWDVSFTPRGIFLLEVNLSCNFFRGSFDIPRYMSLVDRYWLHLEKIERLNRECAETDRQQRAEGHLVVSDKKKYKRNSSSPPTAGTIEGEDRQ